jgi:hypothetical protein
VPIRSIITAIVAAGAAQQAEAVIKAGVGADVVSTASAHIRASGFEQSLWRLLLRQVAQRDHIDPPVHR